MVDEALAAIEQVPGLMLRCPTVRYHLAVAHLHTGQRPEAAVELRQALAAGVPFPESSDGRSRRATLAG